MTSYALRSGALVTVRHASSKYQWLGGTHTPSSAMEVRCAELSFFLSFVPFFFLPSLYSPRSTSGIEGGRLRGLREGCLDRKCQKTNAGLRNKVESDIIHPRLARLICTYFSMPVRAFKVKGTGLKSDIICVKKHFHVCVLIF